MFYYFLNWYFSIDDKINARERNYYTWTIKFDNFSRFHNVISDSLPQSVSVIMTHCEGKRIYDSLLSDEESDRNENAFIRVAFFIVKIKRIYSFAAKLEKAVECTAFWWTQGFKAFGFFAKYCVRSFHSK